MPIQYEERLSRGKEAIDYKSEVNIRVREGYVK